MAADGETYRETTSKKILSSNDYFCLLDKLMRGTKAEVLRALEHFHFSDHVCHTEADPGWCIRDIVATHGSDGAKKAEEEDRLQWQRLHTRFAEVAASMVAQYQKVSRLYARASLRGAPKCVEDKESQEKCAEYINLLLEVAKLTANALREVPTHTDMRSLKETAWSNVYAYIGGDSPTLAITRKE